MYETEQMNAKLKTAIDKAIIMRAENHYKEALSYQESIRFLFDESNPIYFRRYLCGCGITHFTLGNYEQAKADYLKALELPIIGSYDSLEIAAIEGNLANALVELGEIEEAHSYLAHAEKVLRANHVDDWLGDRLETRARAYHAEGKFDEALKAAEEAYQLHCNSFSAESIKVSKRTLDMCRASANTLAICAIEAIRG